MLNDWRMFTDTMKQEQNHVAWHEVLRAISELNGTTHTLVHAAYGDHVDLVVSGGNEGKVLVQWKEYEPVGKHLILTVEGNNGVMTTLDVEGEQITIPISWCIPLEQAVPVCGDMLRSCELARREGLEWLLIEGE